VHVGYGFYYILAFEPFSIPVHRTENGAGTDFLIVQLPSLSQHNSLELRPSTEESHPMLLFITDASMKSLN
jgi:hypothetical protein